MKLRLSHTMHNTESGKRMTAAVANTGKAVAGGIGAAKVDSSHKILSLYILLDRFLFLMFWKFKNHMLNEKNYMYISK